MHDLPVTTTTWVSHINLCRKAEPSGLKGMLEIIYIPFILQMRRLRRRESGILANVT